MIFSTMFHSPAGPIVLEGDDRRLTRIGFGAPGAPRAMPQRQLPPRSSSSSTSPASAPTSTSTSSSAGTPFERRVWDELRAIPYGETASYAEIARRIGRPSACRAVGRANGRNPIAVIVPCHRVVGSDGSLTGYAGGIDMKRALLDLERRHALELPLAS